MRLWIATLLACAAVTSGGCGAQQRASCAGINRAQAVEMARAVKQGMLSRSTDEEQRTFHSDVATDVRLEAEGYAAKVSFRGTGGRRLVALIEDDCYVGWTVH
jgi:hypothetical protein